MMTMMMRLMRTPCATLCSPSADGSGCGGRRPAQRTHSTHLHARAHTRTRTCVSHDAMHPRACIPRSRAVLTNDDAASASPLSNSRTSARTSVAASALSTQHTHTLACTRAHTHCRSTNGARLGLTHVRVGKHRAPAPARERRPRARNRTAHCAPRRRARRARVGGRAQARVAHMTSAGQRGPAPAASPLCNRQASRADRALRARVHVRAQRVRACVRARACCMRGARACHDEPFRADIPVVS
jgi:hypothetical protein